MENNLLTEALNLTLFGMGFVFLFLTLMVVLTSLMSLIVQKFEIKVVVTSGPTMRSPVMIEEETRFIIEKAIRMHRGA